ncbi:MAG TPA: alpha/beta hydrolase [Ilumatobacter sp.]|nr:alpha/beta hydrolase [Ilumatobacter sp.]
MNRVVNRVVISGVIACLIVTACSDDDNPSAESTAAAVTTDIADAAASPATTDEPSESTAAQTAPDTTVPGPALPFDPGPIEWEEFDGDVDVATVTVPVDYSDHDGDTFDLFLARSAALDPDNRIGSLLVNPGGPGYGGSDFAFFAAQIFPRSLRERFDIVGWDPRGTGESDPPIDCIDDYDPYFTDIDTTVETPAEAERLVDVAEEFAALCVEQNDTIYNFVGTNNSARDIDSIRQALGEDTITYFGFSYGSELGATWATLFPDTVRAAVLDGAADPNADSLESTLQQLGGFQAALETFLASCDDSNACAFAPDGDATDAYTALMEDLDETPVPGAPGRPMVNRDVATGAVIQAMYSDTYWPALERSLADAQSGDGGGLLALFDNYYERQPDGTYGNELEAFQTISCADTADRPTVAETDAENVAFHEAAPLLVPEGAVGGYFCNFFPAARDPRVDVTGAGAGPIVVIGTTGDPATPLSSTEAMASTLEDGRLVIVEADQHTGYGVNQCVVELVDRYLIELEAPEGDTLCS